MKKQTKKKTIQNFSCDFIIFEVKQKFVVSDSSLLDKHSSIYGYRIQKTIPNLGVYLNAMCAGVSRQLWKFGWFQVCDTVRKKNCVFQILPCVILSTAINKSSKNNRNVLPIILYDRCILSIFYFSMYFIVARETHVVMELQFEILFNK